MVLYFGSMSTVLKSPVNKLDSGNSFGVQTLNLLLHLFQLLCGVDVSCETPPSRPFLRVLL